MDVLLTVNFCNRFSSLMTIIIIYIIIIYNLLVFTTTDHNIIKHTML